MKFHRVELRPVVALLAALGLVLSLATCGPEAPQVAGEIAPGASPAAGGASPVADASPQPAAAPEDAASVVTPEVATVRPVRPPTPTPTPRARDGEIYRLFTPDTVRVIHTRDLPGTACAPEYEWQYRPWLLREFVQWTPDGSTVLFTDGPHIYAVAADGSRLWDVAVPAAGEGKPVGPMAPFTVSPDGQQVIYATCDYGRSSELARVGVDGTQPQQLTVNSRFESHPAWSPDGKRIAFLAAAQVSGGASDIRPRLYTMAPDGSDIRPVRMAAAAELLPLPPQWSPDGKHIAYTQREVGGRVGLYTVAVDGRDPPQRLSATVSSASWSPDGTRIAFAKPEPDTVSLFTIAVGGWDAQRLRTMPQITGAPAPPMRQPSRPARGSRPWPGRRTGRKFSIHATGFAWSTWTTNRWSMHRRPRIRPRPRTT